MRAFICPGKGSKSHLSKSNSSDKFLSSSDHQNSPIVGEMTLRTTTLDLF